MRKNLVAGMALALGLGMTVAPAVYAADTVTRTESTTYSGTVQTFEPTASRIVIESEDSRKPSTYTYSKTTKFVDENGTEISSEKVREEITRGRQATIFVDPSSKLVSKVMVRPLVEREETTTTTEIN